MTPYEKKIIYASLTGSNYDFNATDTSYELKLSYYALGWLDLILNFAFDYSINSVLNIALGSILVLISGLLWLINRITTQLKSPPEFRFVGIYLLFFPPIIAGTIMALIPIWIFTAFGNYVIFGTFVSNPQNPDTTSSIGLILDTFPSTYNSLGYAITTSTIIALRNQRVGTMFCIIGFCCLITSSKLYFIKPETKREREIAKLRTNLASREYQWQPILWKKSNMIFTSYLLSLLLTVLVEVSLWSDFSNFQFIAMTIILILGYFFDKIFIIQMQDELLSAPLNTAYGFIGQFVTFGANNYLQFILSYTYGIATQFFMRLYLDTYVNIIGIAVNYIVDSIVNFLIYITPKQYYEWNKSIMKYLNRREEKERRKRRDLSNLYNVNTKPNDDKKDRDSQTSLNSSNDNPNKKASDEMKRNDSTDESQSVEPLILNYSNICNDMVIVCYFPYMIYLMMQYRTQTGKLELPISIDTYCPSYDFLYD